MDYNTDTLINYDFLPLLIAMIIGTSLIIVFFFNFYLPFKGERDYIKMEMSRSEEDEYLYWKTELKHLYLRSIPLIGRLFR